MTETISELGKGCAKMFIMPPTPGSLLGGLLKTGLIFACGMIAGAVVESFMNDERTAEAQGPGAADGFRDATAESATDAGLEAENEWNFAAAEPAGDALVDTEERLKFLGGDVSGSPVGNFFDEVSSSFIEMLPTESEIVSWKPILLKDTPDNRGEA